MEAKNVKLIKICDAQEGVSKSGNPWRKVTAVFETSDKYPKQLAVTCFNAQAEEIGKYTPGAQLNVQFRVESRAWVNPQTNAEKWFTEATAESIVPAVVVAQAQEAANPKVSKNAKIDPDSPVDDLPF